jgi:hypothetical protein
VEFYRILKLRSLEMSIKSEVCMIWMEGHLHCLDLMIYGGGGGGGSHGDGDDDH